MKKFESGMIHDPITVSPDATIREVLDLTRENNISGVPVVEGEDLVGIVTHRDVRFETQLDAPVSRVMTPKERLVTVREGADKEEMLELLHKHRIEKVLVVDERVQAARPDHRQGHPQGARLSERLQGRARRGCASARRRHRRRHRRARRGARRGGRRRLVVDTAHGHSKGVLDRVRCDQARSSEPAARSAATSRRPRPRKALVDAGVDGVKVGIGPGSICTTRIVAGIGVPQITAVADVADGARGHGVPVDRRRRHPLLGRHREGARRRRALRDDRQPVRGHRRVAGEVELYQGRTYKSYRGMGSLGAMAQRTARPTATSRTRPTELEKLVPEGIEGRVPYKGASSRSSSS